MFWRILKRDLKRKKTMNIILLLFVVLCSMFASASVNNVIAVNGGISHYFDVAKVPDAVVSVSMMQTMEEDLAKQLEALSGVREVKAQNYLVVFSSKSFLHRGEKLVNFINPAMLLSDSEMAINYFDEDNHKIEEVPKGCFYATIPFTNNSDIKEGDVVELEVGDNRVSLKYMGYLKGAVFSTTSSSSPYLILNHEDYEYIEQNRTNSDYCRDFFIKADDIEVLNSFVKEKGNLYITTKDGFRNYYLFDMISAYILMAISILLMIAAFVVLRFTIGFTIAEEFREIGVMKAVGINDSGIRGLYIVKYLFLSVLGTVIGFFGSIPLSDMMMKTVSKNMVLGSESGKLIGLLSSVAVVLIILLFCYLCTRGIKKLSPIDAVRNGQTGERFRKKSLLRLGSSKLPSTAFLSINDVTSAPKQFFVITLVFMLCVLLMTLMSNFSLTLKSEKLHALFLVPEGDAHIMDAGVIMEFWHDQSWVEEVIRETEKILEENGMPGSASIANTTKCETTHGDKKADIFYGVRKGECSEYLQLEEGVLPKKNDEIVVTESALTALDAMIGDRVTAVIGDTEYEFIITGRISAFLRETAILYEDFEIGALPASNTMGINIIFDGNPDKKQVDENIEKLKKIYDTEKIYNTSDVISNFTGMSDTLALIKKMMMIITVIVTALIVILMERSFISREKSEIALMKAVGVSNGSIVTQHALRFVIVSIVASVLSSAVLLPLSNVVMTAICKMIGDVSHVACDFNALEVFGICPAILIGITLIGSFLTALYTGTIKASDTASIE